MHVMHVIDGLARAGAERMLVEIANRTAADGHRASVCVTRDDLSLAGELRPDVPLHVLRRRRRLSLPEMVRFARIARGSGATLLHVHGRGSLRFVAAVRTLFRLPLPVVFHDHRSLELDASVPRWLRLWGRHHVSRYVGVYARLGEWAREAGIPGERVEVVENALDLRRFADASPAGIREELGLPNGTVLGVVVGNLRTEKGTELLLRALARCRFPARVKVLVVGADRDPAYGRSVRELSVSLGLQDTVLFVGERADVAGIVRACDFGVMPSLSESGPLVLIEFMAAGLPFVSSTVGSISHRVRSLGLPGFVAPDDEEALAAALAELVALSPGERAARGEEGRRIVREHFDIDGVMPAWYRIYAAASGRSAA
jgi:glycosyltransferase involved in cell wall biosynthesis